MEKAFDKIDQLGVNTLRTLSIEAVQKQIQVIPVCQWGQRQWRMPCGPSI